ncbi:MAG: alpha/beta hydrolase [Acetobacteraceae bacterium]
MILPRVLLGLLAMASLFYGAVAATLYFAQRRILFVPDLARPDVMAVGQPGLRAITLRTADGLDLLAWWLPPPSRGRPVLLYFHGNGGNLADRAERVRRFAAAGFGVLMPEYPGYGGNPGSPSERTLFETAAAALQFLEAQDVRDRRVAVYGESLGTGVAAWAAMGRRFGAVVLESPFTSVTALASERYWFLPVPWLVRDPFDTLGRIGRVEAPLLVAVGGRDQVVPPWMGRAVLAAAPDPKRLWLAAEAGHEDLAEFGLIGVVTGFLERAADPENASAAQ